MRYYSTTLCTNIERGRGLRLLYALFFFIPKANPDFEPLYPQVRRWYVEVGDKGTAVRGIGLNDQGAAITVGPWDRNFGFWTDSPDGPFPAESAQEISHDEFNDAWASFFEGLRKGA